ncbi:MAG TPA: hypothetical protein VHM26_00625 [Chitinophagaceae bacterium]|jgi:hypothetical protein|nr:hypothetical protein [Chitinophagaceae bacterium]
MLDLPYYNYYSNKSQFDYEFESVGPKGKIRKIVRFELQDENVYNLGFGDFDENADYVSDEVVSNNGNTEMVLSTIGQIILHFTNKRPEAFVLIEGSTASRTRLYQQKINKFFSQIDIHFKIFGF